MRLFVVGAVAISAASIPGTLMTHQRLRDTDLGRLIELGRIFIRLECFEDALRHARRAVECMPEHANSRQMLADLEQALGR